MKIMEIKYLNLEYFYNEAMLFLKSLPERIMESWLWALLVIWKSIYLYVSAVVFFGIIFLIFKIAYLKRKNINTYAAALLEDGIPEDRLARWEEIRSHMDSENSAEWKMAIIEADLIMDDILKKIGYNGDSIGERLKNIEPSDFDNLKNVWDAHKVRNRIAHEGMQFKLSKEEAIEVIDKYEKALKELKYI